MNDQKKTNTRKVALIAMFAAMGAVLMFFEVVLPFTPGFYKLDLSEVPVLIGTFSFGPLAGCIIELVKTLVKMILKGSPTAGVGDLASFIMGCAFALPAGFIYRANKTRKGALLGLTSGGLCMTLVACLVNAFVLLPVYATAFHMPIDELIAMGTAVNKNISSLSTFVLFAVAPFNLVKAIVVSAVTFLLYKRISRLIKSALD